MRARAGSQKGERGRGVGQPTGRTAWRWRGDRTSAGNRFSPTVELGRRVVLGADRRAFRGRGFSEPTGAIRRGSFPDTPSGVAAGFVRRDGATRKRIHRSDPPGFLSQGTNQAQGVWNDPIAAGRESMSNMPSAPCGGAGFSGRRAARDLPTSPPCRAGVLFSRETNPAPGFSFL